MKLTSVSIASLLLLALAGCAHEPYSISQTASDRFTITGPDPNQLQAKGYMACKAAGFDESAVVEADKNAIQVRCEKKPESFFDTATHYYEKAKDKLNEMTKTDDPK